MKKKFILTLLSLSTICSTIYAAGKATISVVKVQATPALTTEMRKQGSISTVDRVLQSMDANLTSAIQATRKFDVISKSDIDALNLEQDFANSGNVDTSDGNAAKIGKIKGAKYIVVLSVDDFQDYIQKDRFATLGKNLETRKIRFGAVAKIIDSTTGSILETTNFTISNEDISSTDMTTLITGGSATDELIGQLARKMSTKVANRVADVIFPAKILAKTGKIATFNRGDGTDVEIGDEYEVFAVGEALIDPDTGENLGTEEVSVGKIRVLSVTAKTSRALIIEDFGVDKFQVLRLTKKVVPQVIVEDNEI